MIEPKQFNSLSIADRRMEVANDVIRLLETQRLTAENNVFLSFDKGVWDMHDHGGDHWAVIPYLLETAGNCECCALGACVLSLSRFSGAFAPPLREITDPDNLVVRRRADSEWSISLVSNLFGMHMTQMIEVAFELGNGYWLDCKDSDQDMEEHEIACVLSKEEFELAKSYGSQFQDSSMRMKAIMKNILANKGEFKPELAPAGA